MNKTNRVSNIEQATDIVYAQLKELNPEIQRDDVYETIMDEVIESVEYILTDNDTIFIEDNENDPVALDEYLQRKVPNYHDLINEIVDDMLGGEDVLDTEEE